MKTGFLLATCCCSALACSAASPAASKPWSEQTTKSTSKRPAPRASSDLATAQQVQAQSFDAQLVARLVFERTNLERQKAGLSTFRAMPALSTAATGHSEDMAQRNYFSHDGKGWLKKSHMDDRAKSAGVQGKSLAENIAMLPIFRSQQVNTHVSARGEYTQTLQTDGNTYQQLADWALEQWMNSPGHRKNILNPQLGYLGVGVALGDHGGVPYVYLTQDFAGE